MKDYFFVGSEADVGKYHFARLGQKVTWSDDEAHNAILGGVDLVPAEQWTLTAEECKAYPFRGHQRTAPQEIKDKIKAMLAAAQEYRAELEAAKV